MTKSEIIYTPPFSFVFIIRKVQHYEIEAVQSATEVSGCNEHRFRDVSQ